MKLLTDLIMGPYCTALFLTDLLKSNISDTGKKMSSARSGLLNIGQICITQSVFVIGNLFNATCIHQVYCTVNLKKKKWRKKILR